MVPFEAVRKDVGDVAVLSLRGELDMATAPRLGHVFTEIYKRPRSVVVNLAELRFLDSSGLALFMKMSKKLGSAGCTLTLAAPIHSARRVLSVTGLDSVLPVFETEDDALAALAEGS